MIINNKSFELGEKSKEKEMLDIFEKIVNDEIAETPNDNDCCRGVLMNIKQKFKVEIIIKNGN